MKNEYVVVMVTTANREEAEKIAHNLLENKLIACTNIIGPVSSSYRWNDRIEKAEEYVLLLKSRLGLFERLSKKISELHGYQVLAIIAFPIVMAFTDYLRWLDSCLEPFNE